MKYDQDLCLNFDLKRLLWQDELNPRVRCAFGNVCYIMRTSNTPLPRIDDTLQHSGTFLNNLTCVEIVESVLGIS